MKKTMPETIVTKLAQSTHLSPNWSAMAPANSRSVRPNTACDATMTPSVVRS